MGTFKLLTVSALVLNLAGCPLDGDSSANVADGINCWDLNQNRLNDPNEDINNDGAWDVNDCARANTVAQNAMVAFNHQHLCEAFANLGQYPSGCPSNTHTPPTGTLTELTSTSWYDDGMGTDYSCNQPPSSNGPVSIKEINNHYYWVVDGGFIASKQIIDGLDELQNSKCYNNCLADNDCVASWANSYMVGNRVAYECYLFHHSDTISPWEELCGVNRNDCFLSQTTQVQRWSALCP